MEFLKPYGFNAAFLYMELWPGSGLKFREEIRTVLPWRVRHDAEGNVTEVGGSVPAGPDQYLVFADGTRLWLGEELRLGPRADGVPVREALRFPDVPSCHLPAPAVEVAVDDSWTVRNVVGGGRCVVRRVGGRWVVQLSGLEDRVILVCKQGRPPVFGCKART